jgi:hypothetical protein
MTSVEVFTQGLSIFDPKGGGRIENSVELKHTQKFFSFPATGWAGKGNSFAKHGHGCSDLTRVL